MEIIITLLLLPLGVTSEKKSGSFGCYEPTTKSKTSRPPEAVVVQLPILVWGNIFFAKNTIWKNNLSDPKSKIFKLSCHLDSLPLITPRDC